MHAEPGPQEWAEGAALQRQAATRVLAESRGRSAMGVAAQEAQEAQAERRRARERRRRTDALADMSRAALREARQAAHADRAATEALQVRAFFAKELPLPPDPAATQSVAAAAAPMAPIAEEEPRGEASGGADGAQAAWDVPPPPSAPAGHRRGTLREEPLDAGGAQALQGALAAVERELEAAAAQERRARALEVAAAARAGLLPRPPPYARASLAAALDARFEAALDGERRQRRAWERRAAPAPAPRSLPRRGHAAAPGWRDPDGKGGLAMLAPPSGLRYAPPKAFDRFPGPPHPKAAPPSAPPPRSVPPLLRSAALAAADALRGDTFAQLAALEERIFGDAASARGARALRRRGSSDAPGKRAARRERRRRRGGEQALTLSEREQLIVAAAAAGAQAFAAAAAPTPDIPDPQPAPREWRLAADKPPLAPLMPWGLGTPAAWSDEDGDDVGGQAGPHAALTDAELGALIEEGLLSESDQEEEPALQPRTAAAAAHAARSAPPPSSSSGDGYAAGALEAMRSAAATLAQAARAAGPAGPPVRSLDDILASLTRQVSTLDARLRESADAGLGEEPELFTPRDAALLADPAVDGSLSGASSLDDVDLHLLRIKDTLAQLAQPIQSVLAGEPAPTQQPAVPRRSVTTLPIDERLLELFSPSPVGAPASPGTRQAMRDAVAQTVMDNWRPGPRPEPQQAAPAAAAARPPRLPPPPVPAPSPMRWSSNGRLSPVDESGGEEASPALPQSSSIYDDELLGALTGMPRGRL